MFVPNSIRDFNQDYLIIREKVVCGKQSNVKAVRAWIRVYGKKTAEKAAKEAREFYEKYSFRMSQPTVYEKHETEFWKDDPDV